jgi:GNAT superfamily N-acetyltransferase
VILRPARLDDAPALARVHLQCWREAYQGIVSAAYLQNLDLEKRAQSWRETLAPSYAGGRFTFVAEEPGEGVVGFSSGGPLRPEGPGGECYALYLLKSRHRRGIGSGLYGRVVEELKRRNFGSMLVWVLKENLAARKFYESKGGRPGSVSSIVIDRELEQVSYLWDAL